MDKKSNNAPVTGGTNGIGKATACILSKKGLNVTIVGQTSEKCILVAEQIQAVTGNRIEWIAADLSTLNGIKHTATTYKEKNSHLNILINNAGAFFNRRIITVDGYEKTFALNHLNYFFLTHLLLDLLRDSSPSRIVNVSSMAHTGVKTFDFDNLQGEKSFFGWDAYSRSKLCNLLFTYELSRSLFKTNISVNALHPGYVATGFANNNGPIFNAFTWLGAKFFAKGPEHGAETIIHLAVSPEIEGVSGKYFSNLIAIKSSHLSYDTTIASRLWKTSLQMIA